MYVITEKSDNRITEISETLEYQNNGNPIVKNGAYAIGYPVNIYENLEIPEGVCKDKYCYTPEDGFYENSNWVEPVPEVSNAELQEQITELQLAMIELAGGN